MSYYTKSIKVFTSLLYLILLGIGGIAQNADPYSSGVTPQQNNIPVCNSTVVTVTVGNAGSNPLAPNSVEWRINFPYDILIVGDLNLPAPFYEFSRVCAPDDNEIRLAIRTNAEIGFDGDGVNIGAPQFFLNIPVTAVLPNTQRTITVNTFPLPGFGGQGNVAGNDNASSPIVFSPRPCVEYRTVSDGNWNNLSIWEVFNCVVRDEATCNLGTGGWVPATTIPVQGSSTVLVGDDVVLDVNYTVQNCPLTLDDNGASKLTINPQITLGFGGGADGNAYFNSRPVVVKSTADGTGAIGRMLANSQTNGDDNVTVERYLPNGPQRRWNLLTFGVLSSSASIRDAWAGGNRRRVEMSSNRTRYTPALPKGDPPVSELQKSDPSLTAKPFNFPVLNEAGFGEPSDYVPGDGTIITGHRHSNASVANAGGYDWWPELIIEQGEFFWRTPTDRVRAGMLRTTPSSIRPYLPAAATDFGPERGTAWVSNEEINTGFGGGGLINMNLTNAYNNHQAFMLFTRGDRRNLELGYGTTTLRPTGQLMKQSVPVPISPNVLNVVGNPFPAPIDFPSVYNANIGSIQPYFYFWNSQLNGTNGHGAWEAVYRVFVTVIDPVTEEESTVTTWRRSVNISNPPNFGPPSSLAGVNSARVINSSQGIMVQGTSSGGSLVLTETMKTSIGNTTNFRPFDEQPSGNLSVLSANLNFRDATTEELAFVDGINILINNGFKEGLSDESDIKKINSHTGSVGLSIKRGEELLMVESYPNPTTEAVFPLLTPGLSERSFSFTFSPEKLEADGRQVFLRDKFLNTLSPVSTTENSEKAFEGTADAASLSEDRFEIVFKQDNVLPVTFTDITAREIRGDVQVNWKVATEEKMSHYEVEHSRNGTEFGKATKVDAKNTSPASYEWLHIQPGVGDHFYRVRAFNLEGRSLTTRIVKVNIGSMGDPAFKVFPTIVSQTRNVTVQMTAMEKGSYTLQVTDMSGRVISAQTIEHAGGSASLILNLPPALSKGKYNVRLYGTSGNFVESVLQN